MKMKYEWRKQEKTTYATKKQPQLLTIPAQTFMSIHGTGIPMAQSFRRTCKRYIQLLMGSSMHISSMRKHRRVNLMITLFFRLKGSGH